MCIIKVCLFVCGKKCLQTFTDSIEPTPEYAPVAKVAHLAVHCDFALYFQCSLCAGLL